jgi:hypothetical protein
MIEPAKPMQLFEMVQAHRITAVIYSAAKLGLAEALRDSGKTTKELALAVRADSDALQRLLVALATLGLCTMGDDGKFALTEIGRQLDEQASGSIKDWVIFEGELLAKSWTGLLDTIRTGKTGAQLQGVANSFDLMEKTPGNVAIFNAAMSNLTRLVVPDIVDACDFSRSRVVMDIGCGSAALLAAILARNDNLQGIGLDLPRCREAAERQMQDQGLAARFRFRPGDFFKEISGGADTLLLKSVIHDWDDKQCAVILGNCKAALPVDGRLMLIERIMPERAWQDPRHRSHALSSLNMLRGPGGRERSTTEYAALLHASGFELKTITPAGLFSVMQVFPLS